MSTLLLYALSGRLLLINLIQFPMYSLLLLFNHLLGELCAVFIIWCISHHKALGWLTQSLGTMTAKTAIKFSGSKSLVWYHYDKVF